MKIFSYILFILNLLFFIADILLWLKFGGYILPIAILASIVGMYCSYKDIRFRQQIGSIEKYFK